MNRLTITDAHKRFGGVQALRGVSFELAGGEVHALIGENGAGKSTLIRVITGAVQPDQGELRIDGRTITDNTPLLARSLGVAAIYQQPALFADLTVAENIALTTERPGLLRIVNWHARRRRATELLSKLGARIDPDAEIRTLSMAQQQLVEIAGALGTSARIVILDEPTASLGDAETERLFAVIQQMKSAGVGLIYVSHRLNELARIADRVTVLRDGAVVATRTMAASTRDELVHLMVGRDALHAEVAPTPAAKADPVLRLEHVGCRSSGVRDVSLVLRPGEIIGLAGLVGAGRTELARVIFGLTPADSGSIFVAGRETRIENPEQAIRMGIAHLPEDRRRHGVILDLPIAANISLASPARVSRSGFLNPAQETSIAQSYVTRLQIKCAGPHAPVSSLSGGNQQKVALARWLTTEPRIIILDEPTQGVDVHAKAEIHGIIRNLAAQGMAILLISSDLPELMSMAGAIAVMRGGTIVSVIDRGRATPEMVLDLALDHPAAKAAR